MLKNTFGSAKQICDLSVFRSNKFRDQFHPQFENVKWVKQVKKSCKSKKVKKYKKKNSP